MFSSDNGPAFHHRPDQVPDQYDEELNGHMTRLFGKSQAWKTDYPVQRNEKGEIIAEYRFNCGYNGAKGSVYEGGIKVPMILRWPDGLPKIENTNQDKTYDKCLDYLIKRPSVDYFAYSDGEVAFLEIVKKFVENGLLVK